MYLYNKVFFKVNRNVCLIRESDIFGILTYK